MTSTIKVNNVQASDGGNIINQCGTTITLGASGDSIALATGASQTGFGRTGTVDWVTTVQTSTITAATGKGYFVNTTAGTITANLPAGSAGSIVSFADYAATWDDNNFTISPNGSEKIGGVNSDVVLSTEGQSITLVYIDGTQGWINTMDSTSNVRGNPNLVATGGTITTSGDCKIHTFTGPGTFQVTNVSLTPANNTVSYLVVAGGGSGGFDVGGGGGAGGFREVKSPVTPYTASPLDGYPSAPNRITVTATSYPITVGAGGAAPTQGTSPPASPMGISGNPSVFSSITSTAGGGGGGWDTGGAAGLAGGSGGGGAGWGPGTSPGGAGNTPPTTPSQGNNGGTNPAGGTGYMGGSGGGAGAVGANGGPQPISSYNTVTAGATTNISGSPVQYSRGGNGGNDQSPGPATHIAAANTGDGGGGAGNYPTSPGATGTGPNNSGNLGGSGIVIIRYKFQ